MNLKRPLKIIAAPVPALFLFASFFLSSAGAQERLFRYEYNEKSPGTEITIESIFGRLPSWGYAPIRITLKNGSSKPRRWTVSFSSHDSNFNQRLAVSSAFEFSSTPKSELTHDILVPLCTTLNNSYRQEMKISVAGTRLPGRSQNHYAPFSRDWPSIGISEDIASNNLAELNKKVKNSVKPAYANEHFGLAFRGSQLPVDWRGLVGLDALMITENEWRKLSPGSRQAALQWNRMGGQLHLYSTRKNATLQELGFTETNAPAPAPATPNPSTAKKPQPAKPGAPDAAKKNQSRKPIRTSRTLGLVELHSWDGKDLDINATFEAYKPIPKATRSFESDYEKNWGLQKNFGSKSFNRALILIVLLAFGILVGPVNLWVLARPGKRHRLFVTTPLLSLGASVIMATMILFSDGIGGDGLRFTAINLEPDPSERKAYLFQEQIARTGLLLGRDFSLEPGAVITPVNLARSPWSQFDDSNQRRNDLRVRGNQFGGDWFRARSEVGHVLRSVRTTRSRLEIIANTNATEPPRLFSSLGFQLDQLFYVDAKGTVWKSTAPVQTGSEVTLLKCKNSDLNNWWKNAVAPASSSFRINLTRLTSGKNLFFAGTRDQAAGPLTAGNFIRWKDEPVVLFGHLLEVSKADTPES